MWNKRDIEQLKSNCKKVELDIAHLRTVIAKMRSYETDEFAKEISLISKLAERVQSLEERVDSLVKKTARQP